MNKQLKIFFSYILSISLSCAFAHEAMDYDSFSQDERAKVLEIKGRAWVSDSNFQKTPLQLGDMLYANQTIITEKNAHVILNFQANGVIALHENSALTIERATKQNFQHLHLIQGYLLSTHNPELHGRVMGLFFSTSNQDQLFHAPRLELEVDENKTQVFVTKGQLTRIKMAPSSTPE